MSEAPDGVRVDERRLAAILAADVAGYSRLMGRNEEETVRDLEAHQAVILPLIAKHGGSIINIAGDGIVAQFPSAVRAVECAVAMQKIMAERNFDIPADRRMLLRIGVNLGDIIHDGTRTYGDGINVAARLEPLAEPGGICISANVRDAIFGKLGLPLRDIGEKTLKNIARPVHIYQIQPPGTRSRRDWLGTGFRQYRRVAPALGLVVLLAAIAGFGAWRFWPRETLTTRLHANHRCAALHQRERRREPRQSARASRAKSRRCCRPIPCFRGSVSNLRHVCRRRERRTPAGHIRARWRLLKSGDKTAGPGAARRRGERRDRMVGQLRIRRMRTRSLSKKKTAERVYGALGGFNGTDRSRSSRRRRGENRSRALTDYDYYLRASSYHEQVHVATTTLRATKDRGGRARAVSQIDEPQDRSRLDLLTRERLLRMLRELSRPLEIAYRLGREAEEAEEQVAKSDLRDPKTHGSGLCVAWRGIRSLDRRGRSHGRDEPLSMRQRGRAMPFYSPTRASSTRRMEWVVVGRRARLQGFLLGEGQYRVDLLSRRSKQGGA